jgi:hypothetical protein
MRELVGAVEVTTATREGVEVVRAAITPATRRARGFVFDSIARGALPQLIKGS